MAWNVCTSESEAEILVPRQARLLLIDYSTLKNCSSVIPLDMNVLEKYGLHQ